MSSVDNLKRLAGDSNGTANDMNKLNSGTWSFKNGMVYAISESTFALQATLYWCTAEICERLDKMISNQEKKNE